MSLTFRTLLLPVVALTLACATSSRQVQNDSPVLSGEEIASVSVATAYDAVARLRPSYLRSHGGERSVVYMNTHVVGGVEALRDIPAYRVHEIRYLTPAEARSRLGAGHDGGVIIVVTRQPS
jgi:hypothetical protein